MSNDLLKYGFSLGRIHVLEQTLLSANQTERLLEARDLAEKLRILEETIYSEFLQTIKNESDIEESLDNYLSTYYLLLDELGDENISRYFKLPYDMDNIKPFYEKRLALAKKSSIELLVRIAKTDIDLANIRTWWRKPKKITDELVTGGSLNKEIFLTEEAAKTIAKFYRPLAKIMEANATLLEKDLDDCILLILSEYKYEPITANRVIAFFKSKEIEAKNVRLILFGGLNEFRRQTIENNLRYMYA